MKLYVMLAALLICAVFAVLRKDSYIQEREYYSLNFFEETYDLLAKPETVIVQEFRAKQENIGEICVRFNIEELVNLKGNIRFSVCDENGKTILSRTKKLSELTQTEYTQWTKVFVHGKLEKGKTYLLKIETKEVSNKQGTCALYLANHKGSLFRDLTIDGKKQSKRTVTTFKYDAQCDDDMVKMLLLLAVTAVLIIRFRDRYDLNKWILTISPFYCYYIVQSFSKYRISTFFEQLFTVRGLINVILYAILVFVAYVVTNRARYAAVLSAGIVYFLGLANYYVWNFRGCPIVAADLASLQTARNVAGNYDYSLGLEGMWATVLTVSFICLVLSTKKKPGMNLKRRIAGVLAASLLVTGVWGVLFHTDLMKRLDITVSVWMPERDYAKNGSLLSFLLTWTYYIVEKPEDYSVEEVEKITKSYVSDTEEKEGEKKPNIIAIMNESFSDISVDCELETTEDYMPYFRSLTENTVKGNLYVSVLGGNTANTEFEFLTGNSLAFFPSRSIPYNSYVKDTTGSLTWALKQQGYVGMDSIHPYYRDGWNRENVYPLLGFDRFVSIENFRNKKYIREFVSDETDYERVIETYEETRKKTKDPFYTFSVTMQNHGGYSGVHGLIEEKIKVTKPSNVDDQVVQYLNLIKESDDAFKKLISYFKKVKEPTIIVMFGDHQPGFTDSVYDSLMGAKTTTLGICDTAKMYQVPYVIWANYDIEEETRDMSANYLSSYLLKISGLKMTGYQKYLLELMDKVPVISAICYMDEKGVLHTRDEETESSKWIEEYQRVQYNHMFDSENRINDFFFLEE